MLGSIIKYTIANNAPSSRVQLGNLVLEIPLPLTSKAVALPDFDVARSHVLVALHLVSVVLYYYSIVRETCSGELILTLIPTITLYWNRFPGRSFTLRNCWINMR